MDHEKPEEQTMPRRRGVRRTAAQIEALVNQFAQSGKPIGEFCREGGIRPGSMRKWVARSEGGAARGSGCLVAVKVVDRAVGACGVVIRFADGVEVEFSKGVSIPQLRELLGLPGGRRC